MIYVLVPAHNEAPTVGLLLWKVRQLFTSFNREYQLIVVNDGSTDATDEILAPYTRALPLTLLTHRNRQGYARSLEVLVREAVKRTDRPQRDLAVTLQADFSESPDDVLDLIKKLEGGADIVVADRRKRVGASRAESLARRTLAALASRKLGLTGAHDLVGTMRGYRVGTLQRLVREHGDQPFLGHQGWAADVELLARAARHARTIESVPVAGARTEAARPSRLRPIAEAWRAWRAAAALQGLPRPEIAPGTAPLEPAERTDVTLRRHPETDAPPPSERRDRGRGPRGERGQRQGSERAQRPAGEHADRAKRPAAERSERPAAESAPPPDGERQPREPGKSGRGRRRGGRNRKPASPDGRPAVEATAAPRLEIVSDAPPDAADTPAAAADDAMPNDGTRKRRRRRGRGRGRGRGQGQGPAPQGQSAPLPPPPAPPAA